MSYTYNLIVKKLVQRDVIAFFSVLLLAVAAGWLIAQEGNLFTVLAIGIVAGLLIIRDPNLGLMILIALIPLEAIWTVSEGLTITRIMGPVVLVAFFVSQQGKRHSVSHYMPVPMRLALAWILFGLLSLLWSIRPDISLNRLVTEIQLFILAFLVINMLDSPAKARRALLVLSISATFAALVGLQNILINPEMLRAVAGEQSQTRFAAVVAAGVTIFVAMILYGSRRYRWIYLAGALIGIAAILAAVGRGALFSLLIVAFYLVWRNRSSLSQILVTVFILSFIASAGWLLANEFGLIQDAVRNRLQVQVMIDSGAANRAAIWEGFIRYVYPQRPLTGFGLSTSAIAHGQTASAVVLAGGGFRDPHNDLLQILVDLGPVGLLLWLSVYWTIWRQLTRVRTIAVKRNLLDLHWAASLLLILVFMTSLSVTHLWTKLLWFVLAFAMAVVRLLEPHELGFVAKKTNIPLMNRRGDENT